jgi:hypothetical protein
LSLLQTTLLLFWLVPTLAVLSISARTLLNPNKVRLDDLRALVPAQSAVTALAFAGDRDALRNAPVVSAQFARTSRQKFRK